MTVDAAGAGSPPPGSRGGFGLAQAAALRRLAAMDAAAGRRREAIEMLRVAALLLPFEAETWQALGRQLSLARDEHGARAAWKIAAAARRRRS